MTLETQVASLVTSTNALTQVVESKIGEINAAVSSMQTQVNSYLERGFDVWVIDVDLINGNDSATDQNWAMVKTINEAFKRIKPGWINEIRMASNQVHVFDTDVIVGGDIHHQGMDQGIVLIYCRDLITIGKPSLSDSAVLSWNATLTTSMTVGFGGNPVPIIIRHYAGSLFSSNKHAEWGLSQPSAQTVIAHSAVFLNNPSQPFIARPGHLLVRVTDIHQEVAGAHLSTMNAVLFEDSESTLTGVAAPQSWDDVVANTIPLSKAIVNEVIDARLGQVKTFYIDAAQGNDGNRGTSSAPFASVAAALDRVEPGDQVHIYLTGDQPHVYQGEFVHRPTQIASEISFYRNGGTLENTVLRLNGAVLSGPFHLAFTGLHLACDCPTSGPRQGIVPQIAGHRVYLSDCKVTIENATGSTWGLVRDYFDQGASLQLRNTDVAQTTTTGKLLDLNYATGRLTLWGNTLVSGAAGTAITDTIMGLIVDGNGVPRNLLSNSVL